MLAGTTGLLLLLLDNIIISLLNITTLGELSLTLLAALLLLIFFIKFVSNLDEIQ